MKDTYCSKHSDMEGKLSSIQTHVVYIREGINELKKTKSNKDTTNIIKWTIGGMFIITITAIGWVVAGKI